MFFFSFCSQTKPLHATGKATIEYNKKKIVEGKYRCDSDSRAGFDKDTINVEVENEFVPIGLLYVHQFEYSAPGGGSNLPTVVGAPNKSATPIKSAIIYSYGYTI